MIAGVYSSDEWRCAGEAYNWSSLIFGEWHIHCAIQYILFSLKMFGIILWFWPCYISQKQWDRPWKPVETGRNSEDVATSLRSNVATIPSASMCDDLKVHANMKNDGDWASNYETPEFLTSGGPSGGNAAEQASPVYIKEGFFHRG